MTALLVCFTAGGCAEAETDAALVGGYTVSQDFELERRVLRFERDAAAGVRCMQASLPVGTSPTWKRAVLDRSVHQRLAARTFDEAARASYRADTAASENAEAFVCGPRPGSGELCYLPLVSVIGPGALWLFGLPPTEVELSDASQALIDAFRAAHEACWAVGEPDA